MTGILRAPRRAALIIIAALIAGASLVSFAESFRGLYLWARHHGLAGVWATAWPLQVDVFIAVGELALFVALVDQWPARSRAGAWTVTGIGLAVSVAGNVGHVAGHSVTSRVTAAIPPLAAAAALAVGLGVLKRVTAATGSDSSATLVTGSDRVRDILKASPTLPKADVAVMAGVSARTVERVKRELNGAAK